MADYTTSEILNEVSKIFQARIDPGKEGGTLNTDTEYQQLVDLASTTFLLHNDSIFYLAFLARNKLQALVNREIGFLEDMLIALDDLGQLGKQVTDTATLSNANTALLSLDASTSLKNRPETERFSNLMDKFADQFRRNVVSDATGGLVRPRESARDILRADLERVKSLHDRLLSGTFALRDLLEEFVSLDIPAKVSSYSLARIRQNLNDIISNIESDSSTDNIAKSRRHLLTTLASKAAVNLIGTFTDPRDLKIRTPLNPIPSTLAHNGRVTGSGDPPTFRTNAGPWSLPLSDSLSFKINETTTHNVVLDEILGAVLKGRTGENFSLTASDNNLHVIVDPNTYQLSVTSAANFDANTDLVVMSGNTKLGFKHLGTPIHFDSYDVSTDPADVLYHRLIVELRTLLNGSITSFSPGTSHNTGIAYFGNLTGVDGDPSLTLIDDYVGAYVLDSAGRRWEITRIDNPGTWSAPNLVGASVELAVPDGATLPATGACTIHGQAGAMTDTKLFYSPVRASVPTAGANVVIGPSVKTASLGTGSLTLANVLAAIDSGAGAFDTFVYGGMEGQRLRHHVDFQASADDPGKLALVCRSRLNPYIQITSRFLRVSNGTSIMSIEGNSAHKVLGFHEGELDTTAILTPAEFAAKLNELSGVVASVVTTELGSGTAFVIKGTNTISDPTVDFTQLVSEGDQVTLSGELIGGTAQITSVSPTSIDVGGVVFDTGESDIPYLLFREQVEISTTKVTRGSSLRIYEGPTEMGFPLSTDPNVLVYGSISQFEAYDKLGNLLTFRSAVPGDLLRIVGSTTEYEIIEVNGTQLVLATGLPSSLTKAGFEIRSIAAKSYKSLNARLDTFTSSPNLLPKNKFDESLDELDNALTLAVLPGQNFASSRNRARQVTAELLSLLTSTPPREDEYAAEVPQASDNLSDILGDFVVAEVPAVGNILNAFLERKYDRAVALLQSGRIADFYDTDSETGSYGGAVLSAGRAVVNDLPSESSRASDVDKQNNVSVANLDSFNANTTFSDYENARDDIAE